MFIIDNLLLSPIAATIWAARQVHKAIEQEHATEPARITAELSELYMMLETGRITPADFDAREKVLLDLLDGLQEPESRDEKEPVLKAADTAPLPVETSELASHGP